MMTIPLCPAQQKAYAVLQRALTIGSPIIVHGETGQGKTTILNELHRQIGGAFLTMTDFTEAIRKQNPLAMEETFYELLHSTLLKNDIVILDDLHLINDVICG